MLKYCKLLVQNSSWWWTITFSKHVEDIVHSPINALFIKLRNGKNSQKYRSDMFRSSTIIRELVLSLAKVILKHSIKLCPYSLCGSVAACLGVACVLCAEQNETAQHATNIFLLSAHTTIWKLRGLFICRCMVAYNDVMRIWEFPLGNLQQNNCPPVFCDISL
jgi:hypothetical protein